MGLYTFLGLSTRGLLGVVFPAGLSSIFKFFYLYKLISLISYIYYLLENSNLIQTDLKKKMFKNKYKITKQTNVVVLNEKKNIESSIMMGLHHPLFLVDYILLFVSFTFISLNHLSEL